MKKIIQRTIIITIVLIILVIMIFTLFEKVDKGYKIVFSNITLFEFNYINDYQFQLLTSFISILTSIFTIISIIFAVFQWKIREHQKDKAHVNALLEELRHNKNILGTIFIEFDEKSTYHQIKKDLDSISESAIYPLMVDNDNKQKYEKFIKKRSGHNNKNFVPLVNSYIINACSTENYFSLKYPRIFINLGHVNFSIKRHNNYIERYNSIESEEINYRLLNYEKIQDEMIIWLHLRLNFLLIDLIDHVDLELFIDKEYVKKIKEQYL